MCESTQLQLGSSKTSLSRFLADPESEMLTLGNSHHCHFSNVFRNTGLPSATSPEQTILCQKKVFLLYFFCCSLWKMLRNYTSYSQGSNDMRIVGRDSLKDKMIVAHLTFLYSYQYSIKIIGLASI